MNEESSDIELLQAFARHGEQTAFSRLVRRHLDLVYATALRKVGAPDAAQEVAQNTFSALARKAWQFGPDDSLPAWLYKTTLLASREWLRGELRRRRREQTAAELGTTMKTSQDEPALRALLPLLDEALLSLREKDRTALLLRFYENRSLRQVGQALSVSDDTAQKRVANALGRVAAFFQRRGYRTATAALSAAALEHTAQAAPAAAAHSLVLTAEHMAAPALPLWASALSRLAGLSKVQTATVCLLLAGAPISWQLHHIHRSSAELAQFRSLIRTTEQKLTAVQAEATRLKGALAQREAAAAASDAAQVEQAEARRKYEAWKAHLRAELQAEDYRWPADSPFVRIPKAVINHVDFSPAVAQPGTLSQPAREFLGLSPAEREQIEDALHRYFGSLDSLIKNRIQETNSFAGSAIPLSATASRCWVLPALGEELQEQADALEDQIQRTLGPERWALVERSLQSSGTDQLSNILNFNSAKQEQRLAVWLTTTRENTPAIGVQWASDQYCESCSGTPLEYFAPPTAQQTAPGTNRVCNLLKDSASLPAGLKERALDWVSQQADLMGEKETHP